MDSQNRSFDRIGHFLRYRVGVGMVFPIDQAPKEAYGTIVYPPTPGAKVAKFYLPPAEADLEDARETEYFVPPSVQDAPYGELLLNRQPAGCTIRFGRNGEDRAFTFQEGKWYLPLRFNRRGQGGFVPLSMEVQKDNTYIYLRLDLQWDDDVVKVALVETDEGGLPLCLLLPDPAAMR